MKKVKISIDFVVDISVDKFVWLNVFFIVDCCKKLILFFKVMSVMMVNVINFRFFSWIKIVIIVCLVVVKIELVLIIIRFVIVIVDVEVNRFWIYEMGLWVIIGNFRIMVFKKIIVIKFRERIRGGFIWILLIFLGECFIGL